MGIGGAIEGVGKVADVVGGVLDRFWPKKMTEAEKARVTKELKRVLIEEKAQEITDVINARAMAMKEVENAPYSVRLIRGLFRPYAGYLVVTIWASTVAVRFYAAIAPWATRRGPGAMSGPPDLAGLLTGWDFGVIMLVLGFFFGTRSFEKSRGVQNRG